MTTYPLLRRILQSRKLLSDSINLRGMPDSSSFPTEVTNPSLKYDLLEYLVKENSEASATNEGRERGGRGRPVKHSEQAFNEVGMIVTSKVGVRRTSEEPRRSGTTKANMCGASGDDFTRLKNQSMRSLGLRRVAFKACSMHGEELVMYDKVNKQLLCCRCLAVMQLKADADTKEIVMADDYCLQWTLKWRELVVRIS